MGAFFTAWHPIHLKLPSPGHTEMGDSSIYGGLWRVTVQVLDKRRQYWRPEGTGGGQKVVEVAEEAHLSTATRSSPPRQEVPPQAA